MSGSLRLVTGPAREIVSLTDLKNHIMPRIPEAQIDEDAWLDFQILKARDLVERSAGIATFTQTWELKLDYWPTYIHLPRPPLASVTSIVYLDTNGASQTWSSAGYTVDTSSWPGRIYPAYGYYYPTVYGVPKPITITYVAGFTSVDDTRLLSTRNAIMELVSLYYANRAGFAPQLEASILGRNALQCVHEFSDELGGC